MGRLSAVGRAARIVVNSIWLGYFEHEARRRHLAAIEPLETRVMLSTTPVPFQLNSLYSVGAAPSGVVTADVNGDGKLDAIAALSGSNAISVSLGDGRGGFGSPTTFSVGADPVWIAAADFNRDGHIDIVTANSTDDTVSILLGNGHGSFAPPVISGLSTRDYSVPASPQYVVVADFNGDGKLDLATANYATSTTPTLSVLLGNGDGSFANTFNARLGNPGWQPYASSLAVGDFNHDGKLDLAIGSQINGLVVIAQGNGDGTFTYSSYLGLSSPLYPGGWTGIGTSVYSADLNGDGYADLVVAGAWSGPITVGVFLGYGDGNFAPESLYYAGDGPGSLNVADLNGDGKPDLIITDGGQNNTGNQRTDGGVSVLLNNGNGTFQPSSIFATGAGPVAVAVGDFNGDGAKDLLVADGTSNDLSLDLGYGDGTFSAPKILLVNPPPTTQDQTLLQGWPGSISASGDINGDGIKDIVTADATNDGTGLNGPGYVSVMLGNGDGTFQDAVRIDAGHGSLALAVGDFDGDGKSDVAVLNQSDPSISLFSNWTDGTFARQSTISLPTSHVFTIAAADLNGDGKSDLIVPLWFTSSVLVFLSNGDGTFASPVSFADQGGSNSIALGDINGDGKQDLVIGYLWGNAFGVMMNLGTSNGQWLGFSSETVTSTTAPADVAVGDFNGDGKADVVVVRGNTSIGLSIFLGNGNGTFQSPVNMTSPDPDATITTADINGDGKTDLLFGDADINAVDIYLNKGMSGSNWLGLSTPQTVPTGTLVTGIAVGDFNGDGKQDLATSNLVGFNVSVLLQDRPPTASAGGPYSVVEGSTITLTATGSDPDGNRGLYYEWDFNYNGTDFNPTAIGSAVTFDPAVLELAPGSDTVAVRVTDLAGASIVATASVAISVNVTLTGTSGADQFYARWFNGNIQLYQNVAPPTQDDEAGTPTLSVPADQINSLLILGGAGNDTLTIDDSNLGSVAGTAPFGPMGLSFDGGTAATAGGDQIILTGDSGTATSPDSLTLSGTLTATSAQIQAPLNSGSGSATALVSFTNAAAQVVADSGNSNLSVAGSASVQITSATGDDLSASVATGSTITILPGTELSSLNIASGAVVTILPGLGQTLVTHSLTIAAGTANAWAGELDLGNNDLIVRNGNLAQITNQIESGFNAHLGYWNGQGITSSQAANDPSYLTALGVAQNRDAAGNPLFTSFDGYSVGTSDVLVRYTYYADANLDGRVDGTDYTTLDSGFASHLSGWSNGDFNYDGVVGGADYALIDNTFNFQTRFDFSSSQTVNQPTSITLPFSGPGEVNWGDGTTDQWTQTPTSGAVRHTYSNTGSFVVRVAEQPVGQSIHYFPGLTTTVSAPVVIASPSPVTGTTTNLSVLGAGLAANTLTYTWAAVGSSPAEANFVPNDTNSAQNSVATFSTAGNYDLQVTITSLAGVSVVSNVDVTVDQTLSAITVTPAAVTLQLSNANQINTQQFLATSQDQFGDTMNNPADLAWFYSGDGSVDSSGLYTAPDVGTEAVITAASGSVTSNDAIVALRDASGGIAGVDGPDLDVEAIDFDAVAQQLFSGTVANVFPAEPISPSTLTASIDWGDGIVSAGTIVDDGGSFEITGDHTYLAPDVAPVLVSVSNEVSDPATGLGAATITDPGPTVAAGARATLSDDGTFLTLSVLGDDAAGEGQLTYTWAPINGEDPNAVTFDDNGDNDAKNTVATLSVAGECDLAVTITNSYGQSITSDISVNVGQQFSDITVTAANTTVADSGTQPIVATALDQFGQPMANQPASFSWNVSNGLGTVTQAGLYTAPDSSVGLAMITAAANGVSGSISLTVTSSDTFSATAVSDTEIDLTIPPASPGTTQELEAIFPGDGNFHVIDPPSALPGSPTVHPFINLTPDTDYSFRLRQDENGLISYKMAFAATSGGSSLGGDPATYDWGPNPELFGEATESWPSYVAISPSENVEYTDYEHYTFASTGYGQGGDGVRGVWWVNYTIEQVFTSNVAVLPSLWTVRTLTGVTQVFITNISTNSSPHWIVSGLIGIDNVGPLGGSGPLLNVYAPYNAFGKVTVQVNPDPPSPASPPAAPQNLTALPVEIASQDSVRLVWDNTPNNEDGYTIERSANGGSFSPIGKVNADVTSYADTTARKGIEYTYEIFSYNAAGNSATPSNTATADFSATPTGLTAAIDEQSETVNLSWTDTTPDYATDFEIQWSTDGANFYTIDDVPDSGAGSYQYTDQNPVLTEANSYRVVAVRAAVTSDSDELTSDTSNVAPATIIAAPIAVDDTGDDGNDDGSYARYTIPTSGTLVVSVADGVLANDIDPQHLALHVASYTDPAHEGTLHLDPEGNFTYTPKAGFTGTDTFTYIASNGTLDSLPANVSIDVANTPVTAEDDSYTLSGPTIHVNASDANSLGSNDENPDHCAVTYKLVDSTYHGTLVFATDGSFSYIARPGYSGRDAFIYEVTDGNWTSNGAIVTLTIGAPPPPPPFDPATFPNTLKGLYNSYLAAQARLANVGKALADYGDLISDLKQLEDQNVDPSSPEANTEVDKATALLAVVNTSYDNYVSQLHTTLDAAQKYEHNWRAKAALYFKDDDYHQIMSDVLALPTTVQGIDASREQVQKLTDTLKELGDGAEILVRTSSTVLEVAEDTHSTLEVALAVGGGAAALDAGLAAVIQAAVKEGATECALVAAEQICAFQAGQLVVNALSQQAIMLGKLCNASPNTIRIGADAIQLGLLLLSWRAERQLANAGECFVAGTQVVTGDTNGAISEKPIEQIQVGDQVLSRDENDPNGLLEMETVTAIEEHTAYTLSDVTILDSSGHTETFRVTNQHPFYVEGMGWVGASELSTGEKLLQPDGSRATVQSDTSEYDQQGVAVYNFTVNQVHTYFVAQGQNPIWVHNGCYTPQNPRRSTAGQILGYTGDDASKILGDNLEAAGVTRPANSAAHHIVAAAASRAAAARAILARFGIDLNQADNGVFLPQDDSVSAPPTETHSELHSDAYYTYVNTLIENAEAGGKDSVLRALGSIRRQLLQGKLPW